MLWFLSGLWFLSVSWPACLSSGLLGPLSQPTTIRQSQVTLSRPRGSPSSLKDAPARLGENGSRADPTPAQWRSGTSSALATLGLGQREVRAGLDREQGRSGGLAPHPWPSPVR